MMKTHSIILLFSILLFSIQAAATSAGPISMDQHIAVLEQEISSLKQIIIHSQTSMPSQFFNQSRFAEKPMCLPPLTQCTTIYDICCSTGTFCSPNAYCP